MTSAKQKARFLLALLGIGAALCFAVPVKTQAAPLTTEDLSGIKGPDTAEIAATGDPGAEITGRDEMGNSSTQIENGQPFSRRSAVVGQRQSWPGARP